MGFGVEFREDIEEADYRACVVCLKQVTVELVHALFPVPPFPERPRLAECDETLAKEEVVQGGVWPATHSSVRSATPRRATGWLVTRASASVRRA
jgi:hypothetical protein